MARWIRNCFLPKAGAADWGAGTLAFFMREALLVGGWSERANDGDPAWASASNVIVDEPGGSNGFAVLASAGRQIYDPLGRFTQAMVDNGYVIALRGSTNDQNYSMWRIVGFIDANNILIDALGFSPYGWLDESGIAGRILDLGVRPGDGSWVEMDAPGGYNTVRLTVNQANYVQTHIQPKRGLGDSTPTNDVYLYDDDDFAITLNAYFDGNNALFWKHADDDGRLDVVMYGELDDVVPQDTWPGFVWSSSALSYPGQPHLFTGYMLSALSANIAVYGTWLLRGLWSTDEASNNESSYLYRLINGSPGFLRLRKSRIILGDVASQGGYVRGKLPVVRFGYNGLDSYSPVDSQGHWWHLRGGLFVPRNGPYDPQLFRSYS